MSCGSDGGCRRDAIDIMNYDVEINTAALINGAAQLAVARQAQLPAGTRHLLALDLRGQNVSAAREAAIKQAICEKSNGIIGLHEINLMRGD